MSALFVRLQYLLPHHLLCRIVYALTRSRVPWLKNYLIAAFMRAYRPHMGDALQPEPLRYASFNAFFTRALQAGARPIDPDPRRLVAVFSPPFSAPKLSADLQRVATAARL